MQYELMLLLIHCAVLASFFPRTIYGDKRRISQKKEVTLFYVWRQSGRISLIVSFEVFKTHFHGDMYSIKD